jgi:hypothetical protein
MAPLEAGEGALAIISGLFRALPRSYHGSRPFFVDSTDSLLCLAAILGSYENRPNPHRVGRPDPARVGCAHRHRLVWLDAEGPGLLVGAPLLVVFYPSRPGRRGFTLRRAGVMAMLHGQRGRILFVLFSPAPLEAGACTVGSSPASFRAHSGARLAR